MKSAKALEALLLPGFYQVGLEDSAQRKHIVEMCHAAYLIGVAEEREACAQVAEKYADMPPPELVGRMAHEIAGAIRAQGKS